jgi:hypothetical protein
MKYFVAEQSIVREIWGKSDTIIFIFAGSAAEFALNKAVDWLYYTGKLPADPIGRLFSTVAYARQIVFAENEEALKAIDRISGIHTAVETSRQLKIPDWAYRDVLFMLIHYSIAAYELLERKLSLAEKEEVFDVFNRVGQRMHLKGLPANFRDWEIMRKEHMENNLEKSDLTIDLFRQYKKHLGPLRYAILIQGQGLVMPALIRKMLGYNQWNWLRLMLHPYRISRKLKLDWFIKSLMLPRRYQARIRELDMYARFSSSGSPGADGA